MNSVRSSKAKERQIIILKVMADGHLHTSAKLREQLRLHKMLILSSMTALLKAKHIEVVSKTYLNKTTVVGELCAGRGRQNVNLYRITPLGTAELAGIET